MARLDRSSLFALTLGTLFVGAGCGALEPTSSTDDAIRITPVGTENMANLTLQLPVGACLPGGSCSRPLAVTPTLAVDGAATSLNAQVRLTPGNHTLTVGNTSTTISLSAGSVRTLIVPVTKQVCTNEAPPTVPATDFGRVPTLSNAACPTATAVDGVALSSPVAGSFYFNSYYSSCYYYNYGPYDIGTSDCAAFSSSYPVSMLLNGSCFYVSGRDGASICQALKHGDCASLGIDSSYCPQTNPFNAGSDTAVVPGSYTFSTQPNGGGSSETRTVAEGSLSELAFSLPVVGTVPGQFTTRITFADPRELPDAVPTQITSGCERNYSVPASASGTVSLKAFKFSECSYVLNAGGRTVTLNQNGADVTLHRIDVDDVTVTREDGTTFVTRGTYELYYGGVLVAGPYDTNSGIDALAGDYELVVKYNTLEGQKANHYPITL